MAAGQGRRATLQQVADRAGVSIATASRALNGSVAAPASVARVTSAAAELGYIPNDAARQLRVERTMTVGLAIFSLRLPGALDMLGALSRVLDDHGYTLIISDTVGDPARFEVILQRFLERRVDALLCVNPDRVGPVLDRYRELEVPAAAVMSRGRGAGWLPLFAPDLKPAVDEMVQRLQALGHRRVATLLPGGHRGPFQPVWKELETSSVEVSDLQPFGPGFSIDRVVEAVRSGVTAVLTNFPLALETVRACRAAGLRIPEDISVVSIGEETSLAELLELPMSAVAVDLDSFGRAMGEAVVRWLAGDAPERNELFPVARWQERATTGPPRG